jgi:hypothetical protein
MTNAFESACTFETGCISRKFAGGQYTGAKLPTRTCANLPTYGVLVRQARRNRKGLAPLATSTYK